MENKLLIHALWMALGLLATGCSGPQRYLARGNTALADSRYEDATLNYRKAIQKDPRLAAAFRGLAVAQIHCGERVAALSSFERAIELSPSDDALRSEYTDAVLSVYLAGSKRSQT